MDVFCTAVNVAQPMTVLKCFLVFILSPDDLQTTWVHTITYCKHAWAWSNVTNRKASQWGRRKGGAIMLRLGTQQILPDVKTA